MRTDLAEYMPNTEGSGKKNKGIAQDYIYISRVSGTGHVTMTLQNSRKVRTTSLGKDK